LLDILYDGYPSQNWPPLSHYLFISRVFYLLSTLNCCCGKYKYYSLNKFVCRQSIRTLSVTGKPHVKRSSFEFLIWLQFSTLPLQIWKTPLQTLEGICNVPKSQLNFPQFLLEVLDFLLQIPNFLFCSARCNWLTKIIHQWQRSEQNRTGSQEIKTGS
jgi:hypothetical protein